MRESIENIKVCVCAIRLWDIESNTILENNSIFISSEWMAKSMQYITVVKQISTIFAFFKMIIVAVNYCWSSNS